MKKIVNVETCGGVFDIEVFCDKFEQRSENEVMANEVRICFDGIIRGVQHG